ncbi:MAG: membrane protein insertase YidC [Candidatus Caenarcaniphilales bacterium]|nr:membrane protein insertase YidC [Candidatus Caenarcaniphilales bacterium]
MDFGLLTYYVMLPLLEYFRNMLGSYGWSIILVTLVIKAALLPLSMKQMQMSQKMQAQMSKIKPDLEKIQESFNLRKKKYESNPEKLQEVQKEFQEQMMDLYRKQGGFNPLGGCLPTLLQLPILIALYWTFSGPPFQPSTLNIPLEATAKAPTKELSKLKILKSNTANFIGPEGEVSRIKLESNIPEKLLVGETYDLEVKQVQGEGSLPGQYAHWLLLPKGQNPSTVDPHKKVDNSWSDGIVELTQSSEDPLKARIKALKETERFNLQFYLTEDRGHQRFFFIDDLGKIGLWNQSSKSVNIDVLILVILMGISFWLSSKLMMSSNPQPPSLDPSQQEIQKQMQTLMPLMFFGMMAFLPIPAGVFIYFIVSNVIQLAQTLIMQKFPPKSKDDENKQNEQNNEKTKTLKAAKS